MFNFFYPLRIMQPLLFLYKILSFASLSAVPHVSSIFLKSPSKIFLRVIFGLPCFLLKCHEEAKERINYHNNNKKWDEVLFQVFARSRIIENNLRGCFLLILAPVGGGALSVSVSLS